MKAVAILILVALLAAPILSAWPYHRRGVTFVYDGNLRIWVPEYQYRLERRR